MIEMKINEISSKVFSKVKNQLSYPPLNLKKNWKIIKRFGSNFHNGLYGSLPGFAVILSVLKVRSGGIQIPKLSISDKRNGLIVILKEKYMVKTYYFGFMWNDYGKRVAYFIE